MSPLFEVLDDVFSGACAILAELSVVIATL